MGLDQYLLQRQYLSHWSWLKDSDREEDRYTRAYDTAEKVLEVLDYPSEGVEGMEIKMTVLQWRKANAIHRWFVENVQDGNDDCGEYYVSVEQLTELRDICKQIVEECTLEPGLVKNGERLGPDTGGQWEAIIEEGQVIANPELADKLLPTQGGFFFGSTAYNEYYMEDVKYTLEGINRVLENQPEVTQFYYTSSW